MGIILADVAMLNVRMSRTQSVREWQKREFEGGKSFYALKVVYVN
jgi:predicted double-glycine peptidase